MAKVLLINASTLPRNLSYIRLRIFFANTYDNILAESNSNSFSVLSIAHFLNIDKFERQTYG